MEMRRLGKSSLTVPTIGLGTWSTFNTDDDRGWLVDECLASQVWLFDTAANYGKSEACLSRALAGRTANHLVGSKLLAMDESQARSQIKRTLRLFPKLDFYQVHNALNWRDHLPMLELLKAEGRIQAVGATRGVDTPAEQFADVMRTGRLDLVSLRYSPINREAEDVLLPLAQELGIGVLVISPLKGGILDARATQEELEFLGVESWAAAILKWIRSDTRVSCVLTSTQTPGRIRANAQAGWPPLFGREERELVVRIATR